MIHVQYVDTEMNGHQVFLRDKKVEDGKAVTITKCLNDECNDRRVSMDKSMNAASDGATVMVSR